MHACMQGRYQKIGKCQKRYQKIVSAGWFELFWVVSVDFERMFMNFRLL